eukprot:jgi/Picre1/31641/NNA_006992.t1
MLNALAPAIPGFLGGSADLAPSNMTLMKMFGDFQKDSPEERNVRFGAGVIYVMTHDSIGLGEDGPTHQPIEHLASFRAMPNMLTIRPGDGNETAGAYKAAVLNAMPRIQRESRDHLLLCSPDRVCQTWTPPPLMEP